MDYRHVYKGTGIALKNHPDGRQERLPWNQATYETRDVIATVRQYDDGRRERSVNCQLVDNLPARFAELESLV